MNEKGSGREGEAVVWEGSWAETGNFGDPQECVEDPAGKYEMDPSPEEKEPREAFNDSEE